MSGSDKCSDVDHMDDMFAVKSSNEGKSTAIGAISPKS